jgi:hypothetical protein
MLDWIKYRVEVATISGYDLQATGGEAKKLRKGRVALYTCAKRHLAILAPWLSFVRRERNCCNIDNIFLVFGHLFVLIGYSSPFPFGINWYSVSVLLASGWPQVGFSDKKLSFAVIFIV